MSDNVHDEIKEAGLKDFLEEIKQELLRYIRMRIQIVKLETYEKGSKAASSMGYGLIMLAVLSLFLFFAIMGLAFLLGEILGSLAAGFGIIAGVFILVFALILIFKKQIQTSLLNKVILFFRKIESDED